MLYYSAIMLLPFACGAFHLVLWLTDMGSSAFLANVLSVVPCMSSTSAAGLMSRAWPKCGR